MDPSEWFTSWKNTNSRLQKVLLVLIWSLFLLGPLVSLFSLLLIKSSSLTSFIRLNRTKGTCRSTSTSLDTKLSRETGKECCLAYLYFFGRFVESPRSQVRCIKIHENLIISGSWDKSAKVNIHLQHFQMDCSAVGPEDWGLLEEPRP